jgi:hypothetical protein
MKNLVCFLLLLAAVPMCAQSWHPLIAPAGGLDYSEDDTGLHIRTIAGTEVPVYGNLTLLGIDGSEGARTIEATISFSDVPGSEGWLAVRRDHSGRCHGQGQSSYPDAQAGGIVLGAGTHEGIGLFVGNSTPFWYEAPIGQGGLYNTLMLVQGWRGHWRIIGIPYVLPELPLESPGQLKLFLTQEADGVWATGSFILGSITGAVRERLPFQPDTKKRAGIAAVGHEAMTCLADGGPRYSTFTNVIAPIH